MHRLIEYMIECKMLDFGEMIDSGYKGFIVDIDIKMYFRVYVKEKNVINRVTLDLNRLSNKLKFKNKVEKIMEDIDFENTARETCKNKRVKHSELEYLEIEFTHILDKARKTVEGQKRNTLFSKES